MYSVKDDPKGPGFPIRTFTDQSLLTAPHDFSQCATSFIASWCQGIHQMLLKRLIQQNFPSRAGTSPTHSTDQIDFKTSKNLCTPACKTKSPTRVKDKASPPEPKALANKQIHNVKQPKRSQSQTKVATGQRLNSFLPALKPRRNQISNFLNEKPAQNHLPVNRASTRQAIPEPWWRRTGSNRRPEACKATALPTELRPL